MEPLCSDRLRSHIQGTDEAALAKLRALTAEQILQTAPQSYETTPILDGKLITETAYKAHGQPHVPLLLGSTSADTAGNRVRATTKYLFLARFGQWSARAKTACDPDGSTDLATLLARANNDQLLSAGTPHSGEIAFVFGTLGIGGFGPPPPPPTPRDLAVSRMAQSYWVNFAKTGNPNGTGLPPWPRYDAGAKLDWHASRRPGPPHHRRHRLLSGTGKAGANRS